MTREQIKAHIDRLITLHSTRNAMQSDFINNQQVSFDGLFFLCGQNGQVVFTIGHTALCVDWLHSNNVQSHNCVRNPNTGACYVCAKPMKGYERQTPQLTAILEQFDQYNK